MVAEVNKILKRHAICNSWTDQGTKIPTGQLTYMPRAGETAVLFRWTPILQHRRCSQEKYTFDGQDDKWQSLPGICIPFFLVFVTATPITCRGVAAGGTPCSGCILAQPAMEQDSVLLLFI